jgi:hypothetical protein
MDVTFECELNKANAPIQWMFNDLPIEKVFSPESYVITESDNKYRLTIPKCQLKHQGIISLCLPEQNIKTKAMLTVDGKSS